MGVALGLIITTMLSGVLTGGPESVGYGLIIALFFLYPPWLLVLVPVIVIRLFLRAMMNQNLLSKNSERILSGGLYDLPAGVYLFMVVEILFFYEG